jgi:phage terminase large subunit-like protein
MVPKKSSKTTGGAAIMLTALILNRRPRAEFLIVAPTIEIADLAFNQAVGMIQNDPVLKAKFAVAEHLRLIKFRTTGAFLKIKSFDARVVTGSKPAGVLIDELHVIAEMHNADRVMGQLRGGLVSQPEGFLLTITTQSEREPRGVFKSELAKARAVRDGRLQAPILPMLYEFPRDVDWRDTTKWWMVTPNNGWSITVERLVSDYYGAVEAGEEELRRWASQHLNVEIGLALLENSWAGAEFWLEQADPTLTLDELLRRSEVVTMGVDGGGLDDLLGLAVIGRCAVTRDWLIWTRTWAHKIVLDRRKAIASRLLDFEKAGDLTIVEEIGEDIAQIAELAKKVEDTGLLDKVGVDQAGIGAVVDALETDAGIELARIVGISQGWRLSGAIKTLERKLAQRAAWHGAQPIMAWNVGNAKVEPRGNAITITKQAAGTAKIDTLMATFNAVTLMALMPESRRSVYDDIGRRKRLALAA